MFSGLVLSLQIHWTPCTIAQTFHRCKGGAGEDTDRLADGRGVGLAPRPAETYCASQLQNYLQVLSFERQGRRAKLVSAPYPQWNFKLIVQVIIPSSSYSQDQILLKLYPGLVTWVCTWIFFPLNYQMTTERKLATKVFASLIALHQLFSQMLVDRNLTMYIQICWDSFT